VSQLALKMENVSKLYRLGQVGTGTLAHDLNRFWARLRGKKDPFSRIGAVNDTGQAGSEYVWALKDIDLEVKQGEILGIIGRNGAGKSTLLKLLSRVTGPTRGEIHINGRIASLLEVGTGFHPELTGLENIYLNGTILGMSRAEIRAKLDEIVEFSGCANYIDTPVKRYSSGMYVRLAFAVAAHLEPDILIVDEVLAVGDAEFQAKCLGKMKDVSQNSGRTVLFVSHNMGSIRRLCPNSLLLDRGVVKAIGHTEDVIATYLSSGLQVQRKLEWENGENPRCDEIVLLQVEISGEKFGVRSHLETSNELYIYVEYRVLREIQNLRVCLTVVSSDDTEIFSTSDYDFQPEGVKRIAGVYKSICKIPANLFNLGQYTAKIDFEIPRERNLISDQRVSFSFDVLSHNQLGPILAAKPPGLLHPKLEWEIRQID